MSFRINGTIMFYGEKQGNGEDSQPAKTTLFIHQNMTYEIDGVVEFKNRNGEMQQEKFAEKGDYTFNDYGFEVRFTFKENQRDARYRHVLYKAVLKGDNLLIDTYPMPGYFGELKKTDLRQLCIRNGKVTEKVNDSGYEFNDHKLYTYKYVHQGGVCYLFQNKTKYDWYTCNAFQFSNYRGAGLQMSRQTKRNFYRPTLRYEDSDSDGEIPEMEKPGPEVHSHEFTVAPGKEIFVELQEFGLRVHKRQKREPKIENDYFNRNYCAKISPLLVFPKDLDHMIFKKFMEIRQVELAFQDCSAPAVTTFDRFKKGEFSNSYFCVIFAVLADDNSAEDLKEMLDYFKYYGTAPVCTWVIRNDLLDVVKPAVQLHHNVSFIYKKKRRDHKKAKRIAQGIEHCISTHSEKMNKDVITSFMKFDTDQSGAIDKDELAELSATLGNKLSNEQLDTAMTDLDMNGDGVIDLDEFSRWYFTGMNSYGDMTRTMLTGNSVANSMIDSISADLYDIIQQDLRTKKHKVNFSYNDPGSDIGTEIELAFHLVGSHYNEFKVRMNQYEGCLDVHEMKKNTLNSYQSSADFFFPVVEVVMGPFEDPQDKIDMLEDALYEVMNEKQRKSHFPKIHHKDGNVIFGMKLPIEKAGKLWETEIPEKVQAVLAGIDQNIKLKLDLKTSVQEWVDNMETLQAMQNGFKVTLEAEVISNVKHAIIDQVRNAQREQDSGFSKVAKSLLTISPLFLMTMNANLDIKFKDFEMIKRNRLASPLLFTMPDLFKKFGHPIDPKFQKVDLDKPTFQPDKEKDDEAMLKAKNELSGLDDVLTLLSDVVKNETQMMQLNLFFPDFGVIHMTVKSKHLIKIPKLFAQARYSKKKKECEMMAQEQKESGEHIKEGQEGDSDDSDGDNMYKEAY